ncbi:hypothetical protein [Bradyrhizobium monzae]|uniref:hypothetical protein n=1 Tax=Bradyrhizobium sp. Oc8 TaxID=2876780 RepID=UPI001F15EEB1|nr:hypothetical protein [Bradyrhizobium sp. Oc8]
MRFQDALSGAAIRKAEAEWNDLKLADLPRLGNLMLDLLIVRRGSEQALNPLWILRLDLDQTWRMRRAATSPSTNYARDVGPKL